MRTNKQILRGDFPEDHHRKIYFYKCKDCGYVNKTGKLCPACLGESEVIND